ncbi:2OG-Fe(II) oxygenase [Brevundimonas kwangchunensis]|uniref:2OG-Fe(II) oxygenase n=1 Tax=Brevundimonas kwangchunensis TaxID=322163 RepID=A0ABN1GSV8_9CAUL
MSTDDLTFDPAELHAVSAKGDGVASHRLAVLTAMGLWVRQDWAEALRLLERAAAQGHEPAGDDRAALAALPDLGQWLTPPRPRALMAGPAILTVPDFLPPSVCDWLMDQAREETRPALVYDPATGDGLRNDIRTNSASQIGLERMTVTMALVRERIARIAGLPVPGLEWTQVLHYGVGQTFDWHVDWLNPDEPGYAADLASRGQRIATLLVYLNDDYEGGETAFEAGGLRHRGKKGDALMWANTLPQGGVDPRTRHAGLPPTAGEKWVLSQWLRGRAPTG